MNRNELDILSFEISMIRAALYDKLENQYQKADASGDYLAAMEFAAKQAGVQALEIEIQDMITTLKRSFKE